MKTAYKNVQRIASIGIIAWTASFIFPISSWAAINNTALESTQQDSSCRVDTQDPNDLGFRFTKNSQLYADQCVDGARFRPIQNLVLDKSSISFDNYLHNNKFWQAQVSLSEQKVKGVYFHIMKFPVVEGVVAAHTQIRFVFENPKAVKLTHAGGEDFSGDILISFEAAFPEKISYNFALGAFNNYARVAKIMSTAQKQSISPATAIEQYQLDLSDEEQSQLLSALLNYSKKIAISEFYNTLRPNCTTELFDQLDLLPRFKGKHPLFLTMISPDPIAGPSLDGLKARQLVKQRVQNYADEVNGKNQILPIPPHISSTAAFLPEVSGKPWSFVTVMPDSSAMTASEKKAIEEVRKELVMSVPSLIQSVGATMLLEGTSSDGSFFLKSLKGYLAQLPALLRKMDSQLPTQPTQVSLYFAPFESQRSSANLTPLGIPAAIPFAIQDHQIDRADASTREIYYYLGQGIAQAGEAGISQTPKPFLMGAMVQLHLEKNRSKVITQVLVGLERISKPLDEKNDQVHLTEVIVPQKAKGGDRPSMLISHVQEAGATAMEPSIDIQFGPFGSLAGTSGQFGYASLQIYKSYFNCQEQAESTPYFLGQISNKFTGYSILDSLLQGSKIEFHVMDTQVDLNTQKVTNMNLSISTLGFNCLKSTDANNQFTENANKAITSVVNKATDGNLLKTIAPLLQ